RSKTGQCRVGRRPGDGADAAARFGDDSWQPERAAVPPGRGYRRRLRTGSESVKEIGVVTAVLGRRDVSERSLQEIAMAGWKKILRPALAASLIGPLGACAAFR